MGSQAISMLDFGSAKVTDRGAAASRPAGTVAEPILAGELRAERLHVVRLYSIALAVFATIWVLTHGIVALIDPHFEWIRLGVTVVQAAILSVAGWSALYECSRGRLHRATYTTVGALIVAATINLATVRNAEGAAVMTYSVA